MPHRPFSPELVERILSAVPDLVLVISADDHIRFMNHVPPGYDGDALVGKPVGLTLPVGQRIELLRAIRSAREFGENLACSIESTRHDGRLSWWECRVSLLQTGTEEADVIIVARDVTEIRLAEVERRSVAAELDRVMELLPICAWCKRVRDDTGYWEEVSSYIEHETGTGVTHGICPECSDRLIAEGQRAE